MNINKGTATRIKLFIIVKILVTINRRVSGPKRKRVKITATLPVEKARGNPASNMEMNKTTRIRVIHPMLMTLAL